MGTLEQNLIVDTFGEMIEKEKAEILPVESPAGTGKTKTTIDVMNHVYYIGKNKKLAYFVFNSDMKEDIVKRAYMQKVENTSFFTFHSFMLNHALKNDKLKRHFLSSSGELMIDFSKEKYTLRDISNSIRELYKLKVEKETLYAIGSVLDLWMNSSNSMGASYLSFANAFCGDVESSKSESLVIANNIAKNRDKILYDMRRAEEQILANLNSDKISKLNNKALTLSFMMAVSNNILNTQKLTHSAYYKKVFTLAEKMKLNLFSEFDGIILDEGQDIDPIFDNIVKKAGIPILLIGDRNQGIYSFRNAVNMMEKVTGSISPLTLGYSFRFPNDIAQFSNLMLSLKEKEVPVYVKGKYVPYIQNIHDKEINYKDSVSVMMKKVQKEIERMSEYYDSDISRIKKKEISSWLRRSKSAFIARNNLSLIEPLFETINSFKESGILKYVQISLTSSISDTFKKIGKGQFGAKVEKDIERSLANGVSFYAYKRGKSLDELLNSDAVRAGLKQDKKYSFLLDEEKKNAFMYILQDLSSRAKESIKATDKNASIVFTTAHGSKGKEYDDVFLANDFITPDKEGEIKDEERNLAYVAITRTKKKLYFVTGGDGISNPIYSNFKTFKSELEKRLSAPYVYRYDKGEEIEISPYENMTEISFIENGRGAESFLIEYPVSLVHYCNQDEKRGIIKIKNAKSDEVSLYYSNGDDVNKAQYSRVLKEYNFSYGVGIDHEASMYKKKELQVDKKRVTILSTKGQEI